MNVRFLSFVSFLLSPVLTEPVFLTAIRVVDLIEIVKYYTTFLLNVDEATSL